MAIKGDGKSLEWIIAAGVCIWKYSSYELSAIVKTEECYASLLKKKLACPAVPDAQLVLSSKSLTEIGNSEAGFEIQQETLSSGKRMVIKEVDAKV